MRLVVILCIVLILVLLFFVFRKSRSRESYTSIMPLTNYEQSNSGALLVAGTDLVLENVKDILGAIQISMDYTYCDGVKNTYQGGIDNLKFNTKYEPHEYDGFCLFSYGSVYGALLGIRNIISGLSDMYLGQFQLTGRLDEFSPDKATLWFVFGFSFSIDLDLILNFDHDHSLDFTISNIKGTMSCRILMDIEKYNGDLSDVKISSIRIKEPCLTDIGYTLPSSLDIFNGTILALSLGTVNMKELVQKNLENGMRDVFKNVASSMSVKLTDMFSGQPFALLIWQDVLNWLHPAYGVSDWPGIPPNNVIDLCSQNYVYYVLENCIFSGNILPNDAFLPSELGHSNWHYKGKEYPFRPQPGYDGNCQYRETNSTLGVNPLIIQYLSNNDDWTVTGPTNAVKWLNCSNCSNAEECTGTNSRTLSTCDLCSKPNPTDFIDKGIAYIGFKSNWIPGTKPEDAIGYFTPKIFEQTRKVTPGSDWWPYVAVFRVPRAFDYQQKVQEMKRVHGC